MKRFLSASLLAFPLIVKAQDTPTDYKYVFKAYNTSGLYTDGSTEKDSAGFLTYDWNRQLSLFNTSFAFQWTSSKNRIHELELTRLHFDKEIPKTQVVNDSTGQIISTTYRSRTMDLAMEMRYEYIWAFAKKPESKWRGSLGLGFSPHFSHLASAPGNASEFEASRTTVGFKVSVIPRFNYHINEHWMLDFNLPLNFYNSYLEIQRTDNPEVPVAQRDVSTYNFESFTDGLQLRIGLGFKF